MVKVSKLNRTNKGDGMTLWPLSCIMAISHKTFLWEIQINWTIYVVLSYWSSSP